MNTNTQDTSSPTAQEIAARAYSLWETDGRAHGRDVDYWLQAEMELKSGDQAQDAQKSASQSAPQRMNGAEQSRAARSADSNRPNQPNQSGSSNQSNSSSQFKPAQTPSTGKPQSEPTRTGQGISSGKKGPSREAAYV